MHNDRKVLALIAHDGKKADMVAFATFNRQKLAGYDIVATATTGRLLRDKDGQDALAWIADQEWSNGKVDTWALLRRVGPMGPRPAGEHVRVVTEAALARGRPRGRHGLGDRVDTEGRCRPGAGCGIATS